MYETLWNYQKDVRVLGVNGSLRLNVTFMAISNVIRPDLLPKVLLKKMALIIKETFLLVSKKDSFRIIMPLVAHYDLELP